MEDIRREDGEGVFLKEVGGMLLEQSKIIIQSVYGDLYSRCRSTPSLKSDEERMKQVYRKNVSLKSCNRQGLCDNIMNRLPFLMEYTNAAFSEWAKMCLKKEDRNVYIEEIPHTSFLDLFLKNCSDHSSIKEMEYFTSTTQEKNCVCREIIRNCFDELRKEYTVLQEGFHSQLPYELSKSVSPDDSISNVDGQTSVSHRRPSDMIEEARRQKPTDSIQETEEKSEKIVDLKEEKEDSSSVSKKTSSKKSSSPSTLSKHSETSSKSLHSNKSSSHNTKKE